MENSFWYFKDTKAYPRLSKDVETDIAVIGGGLAGLMCAYELTIRGYKVCVLEAARIGSGETGRSSAMISFAHDLIYDRLINKHGVKTARRYLNLNRGGLAKIEHIIKENKIDCEYNNCDMVLFSRTKKEVKNIINEQKAYRELGEKTEIVMETELPFSVTAALQIKGQGYMNPFKFLHGLCNILDKKGVKIFENTKVIEQPKDNTLKVGQHTVKAKFFVIATHFPYLNAPGFYFTKMYQHRSHNVVFSTKYKLKNVYESAEEDGFEYRPVKGGILCGGANVRTGEYKYESQYKIVEKDIKENFKAESEDIISRFSAQDCMTFDLLPYVGKYSNFLDNVYVVTGFNKWGFTNSAAASDIIADMIDGKVTDKNIFDTKRLYFLMAPLQTLANTGELLANFANLLISTDAKELKRIQPGQGAVVTLKGKRIGVYKDEKGKISAVSAVCPHLGCSLKWNKDELSWDCPCHGSRFDTEGNILNNPATTPAHKVSISENKGI